MAVLLQLIYKISEISVKILTFPSRASQTLKGHLLIELLQINMPEWTEILGGETARGKVCPRLRACWGLCAYRAFAGLGRWSRWMEGTQTQCRQSQCEGEEGGISRVLGVGS